jgi:hypothetical protein
MRRSPKLLLHSLFTSPAALGSSARWQVQNLIGSILKCNQVACDKFTAGAGEFVGKADIQQFPQPFVGIKAHPIPIGDSDEHQVEKLFQAGQSMIEPFAEKSMVNPTEGTANGSNAIRPRRLCSFGQHRVKLGRKVCAVYLSLCDLHMQFSLKPRFGK